jgi:hypothetical protein
MPAPVALAPAHRNPFIIGHHAEGEGFCNRKDEVDKIAERFRDPAARLLVYGDRRLGKSSALHEAARRVRDEGLPVAVVDLAVASNAPGAAHRILTAAHDAIGRRWRDAATSLLARLRGSFTLSGSLDASGAPTVTFQAAPTLGTKDPLVITSVLDALEQELEARDETLVLALDEFPRLGKWYGEDVAWQLKELLERHRRLGYILAGSERALIEQMLENKKAGLWKVVDQLHIDPIPATEMVPWMVRRATQTGVRFDVIVAAAIYRLAGPRTRDVVQLARATWDWARSDGVAARHAPEEAMEALVREQSALHERQWSGLREATRAVLLVLATNPDVQVTADETLQRYGLGPKTTVYDALKDLVRDEILMRRGAAYAFDDPFFRRWVQVNASADLGLLAPPMAGTEDLTGETPR